MRIYAKQELSKKNAMEKRARRKKSELKKVRIGIFFFSKKNVTFD